MDFMKIKCLNKKLTDKRQKYYQERDYNDKRKLWLEIQILELRIKLERLKKN